ncbi:MAG: hypothetical protein ACR2LI_14165 [Propionibacteriaceae bacterium]
MSPHQSPDPTVFVLFGATGDLSKRMVMPAFYELSCRGLLPENWLLVGNGRGEIPHESFRDQVRDSLDEFAGGVGSESDWKSFADRLRFAGGGFERSNPGSMLDVLQEAHDELATRARYIHYLAIPPTAFVKITEGLHEHDLLPEDARVVYEKPYGTSTKTFHELDDLVQSVMKEEQVYRIDHFLGKEATQNLHTLRYANEMFDAIWCKEHVDQVQIDVPETLDVDDRAEFYDATGAFRDMIATHLFQVAAEVAMEPPTSMRATDLQNARESVLQAFRPLLAEDVVFGQYEGYRDLPEVADDSITDTLAAVRLWVDTDRWRGVPFVLRSGKQMAKSTQQVSLIMKKPDGPLGQLPGDGSVITVTLAGSGALSVDLVMKKPGPDMSLVEHLVGLSLDEGAAGDSLPPYVALIHDVTVGDRSLFTSSKGLARAWAVAEAIVSDPPTPVPYLPGSWGPTEADKFTGHHGWLIQRS